MLKSLQHCLSAGSRWQLAIQSGGCLYVGVAALTVVVVPRVHHLRGF
jgi:hypothetical protein